VNAVLRALALACTFLALGCGDDAKSFAPSGVQAAPNPNVATLTQISWTTTAPSIGYVSYGLTESLGTTSAVEAQSTTTHRVSLFGLTPNTRYYYQVVTWDGHDAGESPIQSVTTGATPSAVPTLSFTGDTSENGMDELLLLPVTAGSSSVVVVVTPSGQVLWYHVEDRMRSVTRARFSLDKTSVLYGAIDAGGDSEIVRVALDGSSQSSVKVKDLGPDFVELANGNYAAIAFDARESGGKTLRGDKIVEVTATGTSTDVISMWDCFDPSKFPGDGTNGEWTGANALSVSEGADGEADDVFYLGLRDLNTVVQVARGSGKCDWVLGAAAPTLTFATPTDAFVHPGGLVLSGSSLLVLDADGSGANASRAMQYTLDLDAKTATKSWSYVPASPIHVSSLGAVSALTGKRWLVNWSTNGKLELVDDMNRVLWALTAPQGSTLGYHVRADSIDAPENKP
jgi:hypothetical protein